MLGDVPDRHRVSVGADKAYDTAALVAAAREINITPHVTQNMTEHCGSNIDARTTRHVGYRISLAFANRSKKRTAGSRTWLAWTGRHSAASRAWAGCFSSGQRLIILFDCHGCYRQDESVYQTIENPRDAHRIA